MALQKTITLENGLTVPNAYIKIFNAGTDKKMTNILVRYYANAENTLHIYEHGYAFKPDMTDSGENLWKQGYEHLKSLPEFEGAIDA